MIPNWKRVRSLALLAHHVLTRHILFSRRCRFAPLRPARPFRFARRTGPTRTTSKATKSRYGPLHLIILLPSHCIHCTRTCNITLGLRLPLPHTNPFMQKSVFPIHASLSSRARLPRTHSPDTTPWTPPAAAVLPPSSLSLPHLLRPSSPCSLPPSLIHSLAPSCTISLTPHTSSPPPPHPCSSPHTQVQPGDVISASVTFAGATDFGINGSSLVAGGRTYTMNMTSGQTGKQSDYSYTLLPKQTATESVAYFVLEHQPSSCVQKSHRSNRTEHANKVVEQRSTLPFTSHTLRTPMAM